jgi:hypothetical protein
MVEILRTLYQGKWVKGHYIEAIAREKVINRNYIYILSQRISTLTISGDEETVRYFEHVIVKYFDERNLVWLVFDADYFNQIANHPPVKRNDGIYSC